MSLYSLVSRRRFNLFRRSDRGGAVGHPLVHLYQSVYGGNDDRLFDVRPRSVGAELLREVVPHRHNSVSITVKERAAELSGDAQRATQMFQDDSPTQRRGFKDVKAAERLRQCVEGGQRLASRQ